MLPELGELTVSGDSGARCPSAAAPAQPVSEVEDRPAVKFSNLSASQSLLDELAPRLRPEELAERWIVARGLSLLAPPRRCFRPCGELALQEKMDMMAMAARGRRFSEVAPAVPCRATRPRGDVSPGRTAAPPLTRGVRAGSPKTGARCRTTPWLKPARATPRYLYSAAVADACWEERPEGG